MERNRKRKVDDDERLGRLPWHLFYGVRFVTILAETTNRPIVIGHPICVKPSHLNASNSRTVRLRLGNKN